MVPRPSGFASNITDQRRIEFRQSVMFVSARARGLVFPPFDILNQKAAALRQAGHRVISLGQAVPGFPAPPAALEAAHRALGDPNVHRYSADAGLLSLREALCDRLLKHLHVDASPGEVVVTA